MAQPRDVRRAAAAGPPLQVVFSGARRTKALDAAARTQGEALLRAWPDIAACRVNVSGPAPHGVQIDVHTSETKLVVKRRSSRDALLALNSAFDAMSRRLENLGLGGTPEAQAREGRVVERPDGFHWVAADERQEFGPYATREDALASMGEAYEDDEGAEAGESLREAESELGIADWIDPETGAPAEGPCPPHLEQ